LVPRFAPRYPDRLYELIERLDDESLSLAEVARRIGSAAEAEGITRPSPVHIRRLLTSLREFRRDDREIRAAGMEALGQVLGARAANPWVIQRALLRAEECVEVRERRRAR
jgi:hypothetical protein